MYTIELKDEAEQDLERLDKQTARRVNKKLDWLAENFDRASAETLKGKWARFFKLRVGDYRIIYRVLYAENVIEVYRIQHRREVYD